jgi:hypothetical protein
LHLPSLLCHRHARHLSPPARTRRCLQTAEKLSFSLPVTFTVGPRNDPVALKAYARFLMGQDQDSMRELVKGIIEGA